MCSDFEEEDGKWYNDFNDLYPEDKGKWFDTRAFAAYAKELYEEGYKIAISSVIGIHKPTEERLLDYLLYSDDTDVKVKIHDGRNLALIVDSRDKLNDSAPQESDF